jgi:CRP-like cAMP-binding protein
MTKTIAPPIVNRLIEGLPSKVRSEMLGNCDLVNLDFGTILCEPDQPFKYVYFPLTGFISLVVTMKDHQPLEMGLIGNEGMLGVTLALAINNVPLRGIVQGSGTALRMTAEQLRSALCQSPTLVYRLHQYLYVLMAQLSQGAACIHFHEVEARLARWLLMTHDRAHADHFHLTHKFLADMLGVQRSAITIAAGALQRRNLIHYTRGEISILDRIGLEAASCECYRELVADYAEQLS